MQLGGKVHSFEHIEVEDGTSGFTDAEILIRLKSGAAPVRPPGAG
jgi:hypothetical protein